MLAPRRRPRRKRSKKPDPESEEEAAESEDEPATSEDESVEASEPEHESEDDLADESESDDSQDEQEAATSDKKGSPKPSGRACKKSQAKGKTRNVSVHMSTLPRIHRVSTVSVPFIAKRFEPYPLTPKLTSKRFKIDPSAGHF